MKCFNCGYLHNSKNATNCAICGARFDLFCQNCGEANPKEATYCFHCGAKLNVNDIKKTHESKRNIAVLFADISGFTELSEQYTPEEVRTIINECFEYITKPIYDLEGSIDKYIGDCVMVLFGDTMIHQDDPLRAVKCALKMQEAIANYSTEKLQKINLELKLSIGINYGLVVSGGVGSYYDQDYTVIGDVVNTAQRLQTSAASGTILVSESIFQETKEFVDYGIQQSITVKNKKHPISCYKPISLNTSSLHDITLIGREQEYQELSDYFMQHNQICVIGESGTGKTTLVQVFISYLESSHRKIWVENNTVYQNKPYYLLKQIISKILNINPFDSNRIKKNRLGSFIDYVLEDYSEDKIIKNYNYISLIMNLERDAEYDEIINYTEHKDLIREIIDQTMLFFSELAKKQNIVMILDDLQFADAESLAIISELNVVNMKMICISLYNLPLLEDMHRIELHNFNKIQAETLIASYINNQFIHSDLISDIQSASNGNIMYIKEVMRMLQRNNGLIIHNNEVTIKKEFRHQIKQSLHHTILTNILELDKLIVDILSVCSVMGTEFNLNYAFHVLELDYNEELIDMPIKMGLIGFKNILKNGNDTYKIYAFSQDIFRQVIYDNLLQKTKASYHEAIAKQYILHTKNAEEYYEIIAYHYEQTSLKKQKLSYFLQTADYLYNRYIYNSSLSYYKKVLTVTTSNNTLFHVYNRMGIICGILGDYEDALHYFDVAISKTKLDEQINEIKIQKINILKTLSRFDEGIETIAQLETKLKKTSHLYGKLLALKAAFYNILGKKEVFEIAKMSEEILIKANDFESLAQTMMQAGIRYFIIGNLEESISHLNKSYEYANRSKNPNVICQIATNLGIIYHAYGEIDKSFVYLDRAMTLANEVSNRKNYITAAINQGVFQMEKGQFDFAISLFDDVIENSKIVHLVYQLTIALTNKADVLFEQGNYELAIDLYNESLSYAQQYDMPVEIGVNKLGIAKCYLELHQLDTVESLLNEAFIIFEEAEEIGFIGDYYYNLCKYNIYKNQSSLAFEQINTAIQYATESHSLLKEIQYKRQKAMMTKDIDLMNEVLVLFDTFDSNYERSITYFEKYLLTRDIEDIKLAEQYIAEISDCHIKECIKNRKYI